MKNKNLFNNEVFGVNRLVFMSPGGGEVPTEEEQELQAAEEGLEGGSTPIEVATLRALKAEDSAEQKRSKADELHARLEGLTLENLIRKAEEVEQAAKATRDKTASDLASPPATLSGISTPTPNFGKEAAAAELQLTEATNKMLALKSMTTAQKQQHLAKLRAPLEEECKTIEAAAVKLEAEAAKRNADLVSLTMAPSVALSYNSAGKQKIVAGAPGEASLKAGPTPPPPEPAKAPEAVKENVTEKYNITMQYIKNERTGKSLTGDKALDAKVTPDNFKELLKKWGVADGKVEDPATVVAAIKTKQGERGAGQDGILGHETFSKLPEEERNLLTGGPVAEEAPPAETPPAPAPTPEASPVIPESAPAAPAEALPEEKKPLIETFEDSKFYQVKDNIRDLSNEDSKGLTEFATVYLLGETKDVLTVLKVGSDTPIDIHKNYVQQLGDKDWGVKEKNAFKADYYNRQLGQQKIDRDKVYWVESTDKHVQLTDQNAGVGAKKVLDDMGALLTVDANNLKKETNPEKIDKYVISVYETAKALAQSVNSSSPSPTS